MKTTRILIPLAAMALAGCSVVANHQALSNAQDKCAAKGMQFYETESHQTDLIIFGDAQVAGVCVGPGDPHYVSGR